MPSRLREESEQPPWPDGAIAVALPLNEHQRVLLEDALANVARARHDEDLVLAGVVAAAGMRRAKIIQYEHETGVLTVEV